MEKFCTVFALLAVFALLNLVICTGMAAAALWALSALGVLDAWTLGQAFAGGVMLMLLEMFIRGVKG